MSQAKIVAYMSDYCGYCWRAKSLLEAKGLAYDIINVDGDAAMRAKMRELSGKTSVPQIWIGDHHVGGCSELFALENSGQLDRLLKP